MEIAETYNLLKPSDLDLPDFSLAPLMASVYFSLGVSQYMANFIFLYTLVSGVLFENLLVNKVLVPWATGIEHEILHPDREHDSEARVSFWWNDWMYDYNNDKFDLEPHRMHIPFIKWRRYKYQHVRTLHTRGELQVILDSLTGESVCKSRIKGILLTCFLWTTFCSCISVPMELFGSSLPLRVFILINFFIVPMYLWDKYIRNIVNVTYLLDDFYTHRITIIIFILFYLIPTYFLFRSEISMFFYKDLMPYLIKNDYKKSRWVLKWIKKISRMFIATYAIWDRIGFNYCFLVSFSGLFDNWWDSYVLPRYEKDVYYTRIFEVYRVRTTDKMIALYGFLPAAVEVFGKSWYSVWDPLLYNIWVEMRYQKLLYTTPENIISLTSNDNILIYQQNLATQTWASFMGWLESVYDPDPLRCIGFSLWLLHKTWPGLTTFLLAMLYRGLRFKGPDTFQNLGLAPCQLPTRAPFIVFNKYAVPRYFEGQGAEWIPEEKDSEKTQDDYIDKYGFNPIDRDWTVSRNFKWKLTDDKFIGNTEEKKRIQLVSRCKWQKYFVRWSWTYAFTISVIHNFMYRVVFRMLVGTSSTYLIQLSQEAWNNVNLWYVYLEGALWLYGVWHCLAGRHAFVPIIHRACRFHCGIYMSIPKRFFKDEVYQTERYKGIGLVFRDQRLGTKVVKHPFVKFPYDLHIYKRRLTDKLPAVQLSRLKKIRIFIDVSLKKLKENIPKILLLLTLFSVFIYSERENISEMLLYIKTAPFIEYDIFSIDDLQVLKERLLELQKSKS